MSESNQIIIKRVKKVSGDGHHGGAWKVAYADFVTAMMAFFLLMWLLNATTEDQRKGIADYFNPTIPVSPISGGGRDVLNGSSVFAEKTLAKDGAGGAKTKFSSAEEGPQDRHEESSKPADTSKEESAIINTLQEQLLGQLGNADAEGLARHIEMRITHEGLVIELVDIDGSPLFESGSTDPSPTMKLLLQVVAGSLKLLTNGISIVGHTDSKPYSARRNYSNWELSTDRAHVARRLMIEAGLPGNQIDEVAGKADTDPLVKDKDAPQNRRISITIMKS